MASKNTKMQQWLNYRIRVTVADSRMLVGSFMAFDKYMNLVICDCEEFQKVKLKTKHPKTGKVVMEEKEVKRLLGFVIIRGESIVSMTAEAPPPAEPKKQGEGTFSFYQERLFNIKFIVLIKVNYDEIN